MMPSTFSRHRYELPLLAAFVGLGLVELVVVHVLLSLWSPAAAWVLTMLTFAGLIHLLLLIRGMVRHPTLIDDEAVTVRHGARSTLQVPLGQVARVEDVAFAPEERGRRVFRASLVAQPNVALRLAEPVMVGRRQVDTISMRLDEPAAFCADLAARMKARAQRLDVSDPPAVPR